MDTFQNKCLKLIDELLNYSEVRNINFYEDIISLISNFYNSYFKSLISIYFIEENSYSLKVKSNEDETSLNLDLIEDFINSDENIKEISKDIFCVKLAIKNSIFGFCTLEIKDKISKDFKNDIKTSFETISDTISYKIKDFELNEVFKMQLKALQEAVLEKDEAYGVIKKQHKKLKETEKVKSLFLANISHELRTPLNAIIGFSQALDARIFGELNEKQAEYIKDIQISSLHLLGMINEILDISKLEANAMKYTPNRLQASTLINEVINILEPLYKAKKINLTFQSDFNGEIMADYQKFQQILYNLLSNAIKFTPENGKIEIISNSNGKNYLLKIKDNGIGIEKKYHNKIFKKFVHLNNICSGSQNSTGLGLTITKELVKLHKGKITLESELNKGTSFIMEFKNLIV